MSATKRAAIAAIALWAAGCESAPPRPDTSPAQVGAAEPLRIAYPAFSPDVPQVMAAGGPVMDAPKVVAITFPGEQLTTDIERFVATVGATPYWAVATSEYGVGALGALPPIHLTEAAPATIDDVGIQTWLQTKLADTTSGFPAPSINTVYAIFYPTTTSITEGGSMSCVEFLGYHNSTSVLVDGTPIVYAVIPRCSDPQLADLSELQLLTTVASHELIEAASDPQPLDNPAYQTVDDAHSIWSFVLGGGEIGDMCAQNSDTNFQPAGYDYVVQRIWSNAAATAGHDPCVPAAAPAFFSATPTVTPSLVHLDFGGGFSIDAEGYTIPVGGSTTIDFGLYSTLESRGVSWQLSAIDLSNFGGDPQANSTTPPAPVLDLKLDHDVGTNGDHVQLTITVLRQPPGPGGVGSFAIASTLVSDAGPSSPNLNDPTAATDPFSNRTDRVWFSLVATE